ncbi:hypothetical protein [Kitasatospora sp. NBC_00458]|uniref:hypothetical protein n=1 Tax=Kitasatospora sp. NBC_00458 TaxID=2903568 RepID=UPI002E193DAF
MSDTTGQTLRIRSRGSFVGVIGGTLFALPAPTHPAARFSVEPAGDGRVRVVERESGLALAAGPEGERLTHAVLAPADAPDSRWTLLRIGEDGDPVSVDGVDGPGHHLLQLPGTGRFVGRAPFEPLALRPKPITVGGEGRLEPLYFQLS